ncbi:CHODL protein, partial [Polypterus senegalus]
MSSRVAFKEAKNACEIDGGTLLSIENETEQKLIEKLLHDLTSSGSGVSDGDFWIGLTRNGDGGAQTTFAACSELYKWTDGSVSEFRNWYYDEPSCGGEACVVMYHQPTAQHGLGGPYLYQWNDDRCNMKHNFICKYEPEISTSREPTQKDESGKTEEDAQVVAAKSSEACLFVSDDESEKYFPPRQDGRDDEEASPSRYRKRGIPFDKESHVTYPGAGWDHLKDDGRSYDHEGRLLFVESGHVISPDGLWEGEGRQQYGGEVSVPSMESRSLKGKGEAGKAAPAVFKSNEGRDVTERSADKIEKVDRSRPVAPPRPSNRNSKSQEPLQDPAEHVPGADVLIGSRPVGKEKVEVKLPTAELNDKIELRDLEKLLEPICALLQTLINIKNQVEELRETAEAPLKRIWHYLQRFGREAPVMIDAGIQVSPARIVQYKGTQCEPAPRLISSGCQSTVCPTREWGVMTDGAWEAPIVPVQLNSAGTWSDAALMTPPPKKHKSMGVQTAKGLSLYGRESPAVSKPQSKQEIPKVKRGSPDKMGKRIESCEAAVKPSLAEERVELTEFPRCFRSREERQPGGRRRCYNCRQPGHMWRDCSRRTGSGGIEDTPLPKVRRGLNNTPRSG